MSKYTTELRFICEQLAGLEESVGFNDVDEVIAEARPKIFSFNYPIFDPAYKERLETKIIEHYYTREICAETYGRWKLFLKAKMNEIMPYFNQLYKSELLEINPFLDADYTREGNRTDAESRTTQRDDTRKSTDSGRDTRTGTHTGNVTDNTTETDGGSTSVHTEDKNKYSEWNLYSDTPQGGIEGILGAEDEPSLVDNGYLTNATHVIHDGTGTESDSTTTLNTTKGTVGTRTNNLTDNETTDYGKVNNTIGDSNEQMDGDSHGEYFEHVFGRMGGRSQSKMLEEFRKTFLNIDLEVIKALEPLFFQLW